MKAKLKRIMWFALFGAIGFGIGYWVRVEPITEASKYLGTYSYFFVPGAFGGLAFGLASRMQ